MAAAPRQSDRRHAHCLRLRSNTVYEKLGHAETVQLEVHGEGSEAEQQMTAFADTYFGQFIKTPFGMMRSVRSIMGRT